MGVWKLSGHVMAVNGHMVAQRSQTLMFESSRCTRMKKMLNIHTAVVLNYNKVLNHNIKQEFLNVIIMITR